MVIRSLSIRLIAGIIGIEVVMLSLLIWDNARTFRHTAVHQLEESAQGIAQQYAATAARFVYENDFARLLELTERLATRFDIVYVSVLDHNAVPVLTVGEAELAQRFILDLRHEDVTDGILDLERSMSIAGLDVGLVRIGFTLAPLERAVTSAVIRGVIVSATIICVTILLGFWVGQRITKSLRKLASAASEYGEGKSNIDLPDDQPDEVGVAARAFRKMIQDRDAAEAAVVESEKRLRDIADNIDDVVWINSRDFQRTLYVNPAMEKLFGITQEELQKDPYAWGDALAPSEADKLQKTIERILADMASGAAAEIDRFEFPIYKVTSPDGITRDIFARSVAMRDEVGNVERFVGVATDVTQLLGAQEELRSSNERLLQAQKMESIGQLTGGVAHDFNNLLAIILGNLELIEETDDPEERKRLLDTAMTTTLRGGDLTKSLLSFARQARLEPAILDINQLVREMNVWSSRIIPENIDVEVSLLAGLWRVKTDPSLTQNALLNLILNARDAMPRGGKMTIETANVRIDEEYNALRDEHVEPGRYVMLAVSDTGEGIPKESLARVFDPFFTTKPIGTGSGIGLSTVQGFLKQSGGAVRAYSEVGVGSTFKLYFKAVDGKQEVPLPSQPVTDQSKHTGARILIVEDEALVLNALTTILKNAGYQVTSAQSGDEAMQIWGGNPNFDLLVTDIVMPGDLQGTRLAHAMREKVPSLPVIFMSGYASEAAMHGNALRPEDTRLMKPVRRADLLAAINKALTLTAIPDR